MNSQLYTAISRVAYGYVFYYLNINLNLNGHSVNFLPEWACFALILSALPGLALAERSALLLRPLAWILLAANAAEWGLALLGVSLEAGDLYLVNVLIDVVALYFHFQLLTNLASIARGVNASRAQSLLRIRTVTTLVGTAVSALSALPSLAERAPDWLSTAAAAALLVYVVIIVIWTLVTLFGLRADMRRGEGPAQ